MYDTLMQTREWVKVSPNYRKQTVLAKMFVVPCGGPKKSPRTSSIVQVIFSFWSLEISEDILRNQKFIIG